MPNYIFKIWSKSQFLALLVCNDVFKTSSKRLQDILERCLEGLFKTFSRGLLDVFKTPARCLIKLNCFH